MASSGTSVAKISRRVWQAWCAFLAPEPPQPEPKPQQRARSSLFHLRMEARHRDTYLRLAKARARHDPG